MATIPATQKQLNFLKKLTGKDYSGEELTASEASNKIEKALANKGEQVAKLPAQSDDKMLPEHQKVIDEAKKSVWQPSAYDLWKAKVIEENMWWKELRGALESGFVDMSSAQGKILRTAYLAQLFSVLPISSKKE